jgi:hypothetical protein
VSVGVDFDFPATVHMMYLRHQIQPIQCQELCHEQTHLIISNRP